MTTITPNNKRIIEISALEKKYVGMAVDMGLFLRIFEPNGSQVGAYRYHLSENDDVEYFSKAYEKEDPRPIDFPPEDEDEVEEKRYLDFPCPHLSLFAEIRTDKYGNAFLESIRICKVYETGCITAGAHSSVLIKAEANRINEILTSVARIEMAKRT